MSFVSDNAKMRTWDPERNIDLVWDKVSPDGTKYLHLSHEGKDLPFLTWLGETDTSGTSTSIVKMVKWNGEPLSSFSVEETREIIVESLQAFKGIHGNPPTDNIEIRFF